MSMKSVRLIFFLLLSTFLFSEEKLSGAWLMTYEIQDIHYYHDLTLAVNGGKITGDYNNASIQGTLKGKRVHFVATDKKGKSTDYTGTLSNSDLMTLRVAGDEGTYI